MGESEPPGEQLKKRESRVVEDPQRKSGGEPGEGSILEAKKILERCGIQGHGS